MHKNLITSQVKHILKTARKYWFVAIAPAALLTAMAFGFAVARQPCWKASQGLMVRDQTTQQNSRGQFESLDAMKTAQETILEIARNRSLVESSLKTIGPPAKRETTGAWPSQDEIDDALDGIMVSAPKGAEFGKTEEFPGVRHGRPLANLRRAKSLVGHSTRLATTERRSRRRPTKDGSALGNWKTSSNG